MSLNKVFSLLLILLTTLNLNADDYKLGKESKKQAGIPQGKLTEHTWNESKVYPGTTRKYWIYISIMVTALCPWK